MTSIFRTEFKFLFHQDYTDSYVWKIDRKGTHIDMYSVFRPQLKLLRREISIIHINGVEKESCIHI